MNFLAGSGGGFDVVTIYSGSSLMATMWEQADAPFPASVFSSSDLLAFEGLGTIYNLKIWSPGSKFVIGISSYYRKKE